MEKQELLKVTQSKIEHCIQTKRTKLDEVKQSLVMLQATVQREMQENEKTFFDLIALIEMTQTKVMQMIKDEEMAAITKATSLKEQLEKELAELTRRNQELMEISETEDHIQFLQSLCFPYEDEDVTTITVFAVSSGAMRKELSQLKAHLEEIVTREPLKTPSKVCSLNKDSTHLPKQQEVTNKANLLKSCSLKKDSSDLLKQQELRNRADFLKNACQLTLDINTANRNLLLSEGNLKVSSSEEVQDYPDHPDRFDWRRQILCKEGLSGSCFYWEVERNGAGAEIGIAYKGISRKTGANTVLGRNNKSWSLFCSNTTYVAWHENKETKITAPFCSRIGMYLDWSAGTLSFYTVSQPMILLHRFNTTFTEPVYPGFCIYYSDSSVIICHLT